MDGFPLAFDSIRRRTVVTEDEANLTCIMESSVTF